MMLHPEDGEYRHQLIDREAHYNQKGKKRNKGGGGGIFSRWRKG
jgi:hypothetical protein